MCVAQVNGPNRANNATLNGAFNGNMNAGSNNGQGNGEVYLTIFLLSQPSLGGNHRSTHMTPRTPSTDPGGSKTTHPPTHPSAAALTQPSPSSLPPLTLRAHPTVPAGNNTAGEKNGSYNGRNNTGNGNGSSNGERTG